MTPDQLAEWIDKLAIREVLERYMRYNDDGDAARIAELFDEDAAFQVMGNVVVGREAIRAMFEPLGAAGERARWSDPGHLFEQPRSVHLSSNPVIDVDGDLATAETDFLVVGRDEAGRAKLQLVGRYRDRLRRGGNGRWVITCRTGVSVAKPGEAGTDADWQRAIATMPDETRGKLRI
jgi:ketosteroid isomerase-like protein